jgi:purine-nucleoside phosphorylase
MKVLAGPRVDLDPAGAAAKLCRRLAGDGGKVVSLAALGLRNPYRRYSAAEIEALRGALRGEAGLVGFVCRGVAADGAMSDAARPDSIRVVAVTDHVNLAWRSPLAGPNDDRTGPRFPSMDHVYEPSAATASAPAPALTPGGDEDGMIVVRGVVAGVPDDRALSEYEIQAVARFGWVAASSELVAPVIVAVHMGLRVAAVVMV